MDQQNIILEGVHYATGKVIRLGIRNGIIYSLADIDEKYWPGEADREKLKVIAPGLVDIQVNGFNGIDFNDPGITAEQVESVSSALLRTGITRYYPTLVTGSRRKTTTILKTIASAIGRKGLASQMIGGVHLEGPFISKEDGPRGAHLKRYCLDPDIALLQGWQEAAGGRIRIITLAPELPGTRELIRECADMGILVAIGHTSGSTEDIQMAVGEGARLSTHLGNGTHSLLPRHPNTIWDQLADDRLYASMIADGFHLPDSVLKVFMRTKGEKAILASDCMPQAGLGPGVYDSPAAGRIRLAENGKLHREGNPSLLAGSAKPLLDDVRKVAQTEEFPAAWDMGSVHPSRMLNRAANHGLFVGAPADLVMLDPDLTRLRLTRVLKSGTEYAL